MTFSAATVRYFASRAWPPLSASCTPRRGRSSGARDTGQSPAPSFSCFRSPSRFVRTCTIICSWSPRWRAVVAVHYAGIACEMNAIAAFADSGEASTPYFTTCRGIFRQQPGSINPPRSGWSACPYGSRCPQTTSIVSLQSCAKFHGLTPGGALRQRGRVVGRRTKRGLISFTGGLICAGLGTRTLADGIL